MSDQQHSRRTVRGLPHPKPRCPRMLPGVRVTAFRAANPAGFETSAAPDSEPVPPV
ncbi:hypothetical protein [Nocardia nepalensis]|uniref:hypothetical protein n=1 Tax=Nocardia nepalensis TaxID=3375448 RepID=UPI003B66CA2B